MSVIENSIIKCCLLIFISSLSLLAQESTKSSVDSKAVKAPEYRIGQSVRSADSSKLVLIISISRTSFSREKMIALARQIKSDYPKEEQLSVIILDSFKSAKRLSAMKIDNPNYTKDHKAVRGYYFLSETSGIEHISFSPERGAETKISLNKNEKN